MIMIAQSETTDDNTVQPQRSLPIKNAVPSSFKFKVFGCIAAALVFLLSVASARATNPCSETQHWLEYPNGSTSCKDCSPCYPGQGLSTECGKRISSNAMVMCLPCRQGVSFSDKDDTSSCTPCSSCAEDQVVLHNCSLDRDIKCAKRCHSKNRYYNDDKGECLACSNCCGDEQDVVEDECKEKLGVGSNMICSFDSSFNRCDKSTTYPHKLTTVENNNHGTVPRRDSKNEDDALPPTTQSSHLSQRKDQDYRAAAGISVVILALLVVAGCFYFYKKRQVNNSVWCNHGDVERGNPDSTTSQRVECSFMDEKALEDEAEVKLPMIDKSYSLEAKSLESTEPLLKEGDQEILTCSSEVDIKEDGAKETLTKRHGLEPVLHESREPLPKEENPGTLICAGKMETKKDSKLLSSLLNHEDDLQEISGRLDTALPGVGTYRVVAQHYGLDHYKISSVLEKHARGPSTALLGWLAAYKPELTVQEFAAVVKEKAKRKDVVKVLLEYDSNNK